MADITGFNPSAAQERINDLDWAFRDAQQTYTDAWFGFYGDLSKLWYSPKAVEFAGYAYKVATEVIEEYGKMWDTVMRNTIAAYDILASSNGDAAFSTVYNALEESMIINKASDIVPEDFMEEGPGGEVGMNIALVKLSLTSFKDGLTKFYGELEALPLDIDFYDPEGELKAKFKALILKFKEFSGERFSELFTKLEGLITTEIDNIIIAKESAADTLNA